MPVTIEDVAAAARRIGPHVLRTPLRRSAWLSAAAGADVYLKLETLQPTFSYKVRGAWNAVLALQERGVRHALVTASAGNHGRALAHAAAAAGVPLAVFVPQGAPRVKIEALRATGAVLRTASDYDAAETGAKDEARRTGAVYVSPYSDPDVIAGAGTIGLEILDDLPDVAAVVGPVGGGGLVSGIAVATAGRARVVGVEAAASTPFTASLAAGRIVPIAVAPTLADGLAGNLDPDAITFGYVRRLVSRIAVVPEDAIRSAVRALAREERLIAEGAAAVGVAALMTGAAAVEPGARVAVVLSGANIDPDVLRGLL